MSKIEDLLHPVDHAEILIINSDHRIVTFTVLQPEKSFAPGGLIYNTILQTASLVYNLTAKKTIKSRNIGEVDYLVAQLLAKEALDLGTFIQPGTTIGTNPFKIQRGI